MVTTSKPVAGYIRVSRKGERADDKFRSPDLQRQAITRYAEAENLTVDFREPEIDVSGSRARRPVLDAILTDIDAGRLGGIVVAKLDRLARMTPGDRIRLFERVEATGGVVLSAGEQLDTSTPEGRFARDVFLGVARLQWEQFRAGLERAKAGAIAEGIGVRSRPPTGYRVKGGDGKDRRQLVPDGRTARVVRQVFEARADGASTGQCAQILEDAGVTTSQGSVSWSRQAVSGLLKNRSVLGEIAYGRDRRFTNPNAHPPIVSRELFDRVQAMWGAVRTSAEPRGKRPYLATGLVRCSSCSYTCQATTTSRGVPIYRCQPRGHSGGRCPAPARARAKDVDQALEQLMWNYAADVSAERAAAPASPDLAPLMEAYDDACRLLDQAKSLELQKALGDEWPAMVQERAAEVERARTALEAERRNSDTAEAPDPVELEERWPSMTVERKRDMLAAILHTDVIELRRDPRELVIWPRDVTDADENARLQDFYATLPRRGYRSAPTLEPFPAPPPEAELLALEGVTQRAAHGSAERPAVPTEAKVMATVRARREAE